MADEQANEATTEEGNLQTIAKMAAGIALAEIETRISNLEETAGQVKIALRQLTEGRQTQLDALMTIEKRTAADSATRAQFAGQLAAFEKELAEVKTMAQRSADADYARSLGGGQGGN